MMLKQLTLCMLLMAVPAAYAQPVPAASPRPRPAIAADSNAPSSADESLQRTVSVDFPEGTTFRQALDKLRDMSEANMIVNWNAMQQYGITPDNPVILPALRNVTVVKTLQLLLDQVSASLGGVTRLGWIAEDNIVYISTRESLQEYLNETTTQRRARTTEVQINLVDKMKDTYFDPAAAGVVAIGAIKGELERSGKNVTDELEKLLVATRSLGLRNALHMTLRDLYQQTGKPSEAMMHLTQMLRENDEAIAAGMRPPPDRPTGSRGGGRGEDPSRGGGRSEDPMRGGRGEDPMRGGDPSRTQDEGSRGGRGG